MWLQQLPLVDRREPFISSEPTGSSTCPMWQVELKGPPWSRKSSLQTPSLGLPLWHRPTSEFAGRSWFSESSLCLQPTLQEGLSPGLSLMRQTLLAQAQLASRDSLPRKGPRCLKRGSLPSSRTSVYQTCSIPRLLPKETFVSRLLDGLRSILIPKSVEGLLMSPSPSLLTGHVFSPSRPSRASRCQTSSCPPMLASTEEPQMWVYGSKTLLEETTPARLYQESETMSSTVYLQNGMRTWRRQGSIQTV